MEEKHFHLGTKAVIVYQNKVLLLKTDATYTGGKVFWDFPGGRVKRDTVSTPENLKTNLIREVSEETGISDLVVERFIHAAAVPHDIKPEEKLGLVLFMYRCSVFNQPVLRLSNEHTEYGWFTEKVLPTDLKHHLAFAVKKALSLDNTGRKKVF